MLIVSYSAYSFMSGPRLDPQLRSAISTNGTDSMWVQLMFVDEACMYDLHAFEPWKAF